jgi:hypothetical protein
MENQIQLNSTLQLPTNKCNELDEYGKHILYISNQILIIYPWIMIIFGTISNILSIIVLTRKKLRKSSTFFYLACLSAIDLTVVYLFCINFITYYHLNIDLQSKHVILCKFFAFSIYFLPQYSAWTCAAVSIDRVIGVIFTIHGRYAATAKRWNTPLRARNIVFIIGTCLFLLNLQFLFYPNEYTNNNNNNNNTRQMIEDVNAIYCSPENIPRFQTYYNNIWVYVDLSINVLIPFGIMILCSIIIIIRVRKTAQNLDNSRKRSVQPSVVTSTAANSNGACTTTTTTLRKKSNFISSSSSKARNISTMLATNNFVFISLTLPIVVFLSVTPAINDESVCANLRAKLRLAKIICIILMNTNCTVNIFVYSVMASQFRRELIILFCDTFKKRFKKDVNKMKITQNRSNSIVNQNQNDNTLTVTYT